MNRALNTGFADRLKTAAEAKAALLAKFQPRPSIVDPNFTGRPERRAAELEQVRGKRAEARAAARQTALETQEAARKAQLALDAADIDAKRGQRKQRKVLTKVEAKAKRDARYAARKAR